MMLYKINKQSLEFWIQNERGGNHTTLISIKKEISSIIHGTRSTRKNTTYNENIFKYFYKNYIFFVDEKTKSILQILNSDLNINSDIIKQRIEEARSNLKALYFLDNNILDDYRKITKSSDTLPIIKRKLTAMIHAAKSYSNNSYSYHFDNLIISVDEQAVKISKLLETNTKPSNQDILDKSYKRIAQTLGLNETLDNFKIKPKKYEYTASTY